jgi:hypothetical protein
MAGMMGWMDVASATPPSPSRLPLPLSQTSTHGDTAEAAEAAGAAFVEGSAAAAMGSNGSNRATKATDSSHGHTNGSIRSTARRQTFGRHGD